mgnify:CR=1 FL=1
MSFRPQVLTVPFGGTGDTSLTAYAVLAGGTTSTGPVQSLASVGTAGQVLTSNGAGSLPSFQNATDTALTRTAVGAGAYTTLATDQYIGKTSITGGGDTITLIAAATVGGRFYHIKDESGTAGTDNITIDGNGAETIDGAATFVINTNYGSVKIFSTGSAWFLI